MFGSSLVPFANKFPKNTKLYKLMTKKETPTLSFDNVGEYFLLVV